MKDSDSEIIEKLGTTAFPSLIILTPDGETVVYDGDLLGSASLCTNSSKFCREPLCTTNYVHVMHGLIRAGKFKVKELSKFLSKHAAEASAKDAGDTLSKGKSDADVDDEGDNAQDKVVPQVNMGSSM